MKPLFYLSFLFFSFLSFGQNNNSNLFIKERTSNHYGSVPVFDVDKIKLNESIIKTLQKQIPEFIATFNKVQEVYSDIYIEVEEKQETVFKSVSDYYGFNIIEKELRTTLDLIFPKTNYCGYNLAPSNHFRERSSVNLFFYDGFTIKVSLNDLPVNKHIPITISYPNEDKEIEVRAIYHPNGNVKILYNFHSDYPVSEPFGFYGIYNLDGTPIKETFLEKEFKNEYIPFYFESNGKTLLSSVLNEFNCQGKQKVKFPIIKKIYDTNYGNLWIANYTVTLYNRNDKFSTEEIENAIENYMVIVRDEDAKVLVNEKIDNCHQNIYRTGKTFELLSIDDKELKEKTYKQLEEETGKIIIVVNDFPYTSKDFIIKEYDEYPKFELKNFILPYKMKFFTDEFKKVTSELLFVEYNNSRMETSSIRSGFIINPVENKTYKIFDTDILLKYNMKNFRFAKQKTSNYELFTKFQLEEKAISLIFPKKIIKVFDKEKNKPKGNKNIEFVVDEILYQDNTLEQDKYFEVILSGKFADDVIVKDVVLGKEFQYDFRMKVKENVLEIYIDENLLISKTSKK